MGKDKKEDSKATRVKNASVVPSQEDKKNPPCDETEIKQTVNLIDKLPIKPEQKLQLFSMMSSSSFEGPLPPSSQFKGYEDTVPGAGDRIIKMAEEINAASVRRIDARTKVHLRQNTFGFILSIGILGITLAALIMGMKEGLWLVVAELVTMLGIFLGNKLSKKNKV